MRGSSLAAIRVKAFAKINLTLQVLGRRPDGYHELRTTFQTVALHDTLTITPSRGPFELRCSNPACPDDASNLVWQAADAVWRAAGRRGVPAHVRVRLDKRIPLQAGLGGGSSDAAAALRAFSKLWRARLSGARLARIAARIGADVPFFLQGGTALGRGRGDRLRPLDDWPASWVVLVLPNFGVSTREAYGWWDEDLRLMTPEAEPSTLREPQGRPEPGRGTTGSGSFRAASRDESLRSRPRDSDRVERELGNDLQRSVGARHPGIPRIVEALTTAGARHAAMSGSGSSVFGLFAARREAESAARALKTGGQRTMMTRTLGRMDYQRRSHPESKSG